MRLLAPGDVRQTSEKLCNTVVRSVKAYAEAAVRRLVRDDAEMLTLFAAVKQLYVNFYEGHLEKSDVEHLAEKARRIVNT